MELAKHKTHRNNKYLNWLRSQKCVVTDQTAECAHHIRLGTNGGTGLKPSDYFCLPLKNEYHTTGAKALHMIGEETFLNEFRINPITTFIKQLKQFLQDEYQIIYTLTKKNEKDILAELIEIVETKNTKTKPTKKKTKKKVKVVKEKSDKEKEFYEVAKAVKRARDKELRQKLKESASQPDDKFLKLKEEQKQKQKEFRDKNKKKAADFRKKLAAKLKNKAK